MRQTSETDLYASRDVSNGLAHGTVTSEEKIHPEYPKSFPVSLTIAVSNTILL